MFVTEETLLGVGLCCHVVCTQLIFVELIRQVLFGPTDLIRLHSAQLKEELSTFQLCQGGWGHEGEFADQHRLDDPLAWTLWRGLKKYTDG